MRSAEKPVRVVLGVAVVACVLLLATGCDDRQSQQAAANYARQLQQRQAEQMAEYDRQMERASEEDKRRDALLDKAEEDNRRGDAQSDRYEALLAKWEEQAKKDDVRVAKAEEQSQRLDKLLDRWDQILSALERHSDLPVPTDALKAPTTSASGETTQAVELRR